MNIRSAAAIVTGGSRGLGKEIARRLAREGAKVVIVARNEAEVAAAAAELRESGEVHGLAFDVGDKEAIHKIAGAAAALVGPIDVLVHCASTLGPVPMPLLLDTDCEDLDEVLQTNLVGPFRLTKAIAGPMVLRKKGVVIFASSDAAVSAYERWGSYGVSKAAQDHLARSFAAELDPIRFFSVDPGEMDTKMHADAMPDADPTTLARAADVAAIFVDIVRHASTIPNGSRLVASAFAEEQRSSR